MSKRLRLVFCLLFFACLFLPAADFGLILDQSADYGGFGNNETFTYSGILVPSLTTLLGDTGGFYISLGFEAACNEEWFFVPELLRTELSFHNGIFGFTIGRMFYSDPLGFIAEGLFDGMQFSLVNEAGAFSVGVWYTGFLYKRRANIAMTQDELVSFVTPLDFGDFQNTYFAPRRFITALGWQHLGGPIQGSLSLLGQFDLSEGFNFGDDELLHSQYLIGRLSMPGRFFSMSLGGSLGLIQYNGDFGMSFAAELGLAFMPVARFPNKISLLARYSSGGLLGDGLVAFQPITTKAQGNIFNAKLSGLSLVSLDYIARLNRTFGFGVTSTYLIRSDLETYRAYPVSSESDTGYFLGNEFFARLLWNPASDLQINFGGGAFLPSFGNAAPGADMSWRAELNVVLALW
jgi:hypothetical protein